MEGGAWGRVNCVSSRAFFFWFCIVFIFFACQRDLVMPIVEVSNFITVPQIDYLKIFLYQLGTSCIVLIDFYEVSHWPPIWIDSPTMQIDSINIHEKFQQRLSQQVCDKWKRKDLKQLFLKLVFFTEQRWLPMMLLGSQEVITERKNTSGLKIDCSVSVT